MASLFKAVAEFTPALAADAAEVACSGWVSPRRDGGDQTYFAAQHEGWRGRLASGGAPLVVALGSEQLLEVVVGSGQARHAVAMEKPGTVAAGDLGEVLDGGRECTGPVAVPEHGAKQPVEPTPHCTGLLALVVAQEPCRRVHPGIGALHLRPERRRAFQAVADLPPEPRELRGRAPFSKTRSRLLATASSRPFSFRPGAASGVRPSSVMALRTAAQ